VQPPVERGLVGLHPRARRRVLAAQKGGLS
jgi:hypothetical protein